MFSKNIKALSLFLVLAAVMIVAVGAVSAASGDAINANVTMSDDTVSPGSMDIAGTVATNNTTAEVGVGQAVNSTGTNSSSVTAPKWTLNSTVYNDSTLTHAIDGLTITSPADGVELGATGAFTISTTPASGQFTNGTTYYLKLTSVASNAFSTDGNNYATVAADTVYPIAFTYTGPVMTLDKNASTITVGDDWSFSGTLVDSTGKALAYQTVTVNANSESDTIKTDANGKFVYNSTLYNALNAPLNAATTTNYTVSFTYGTATSTAQLNVTKKNLKIVGSLNATTINFGDSITFNGSLYDANGKLMNISTITLTATIKDSTATEKDTVTLTYNEKTGTYSVADTTVVKALAAGTYYITLNGPSDNTNYDFNTSNVMVLTINKVATSIKGNDTITTTVGNLGSGATLDATFIELVSNTTTGLETVKGTWTVVVKNADGTPISNVAITGTPATATIKNTEITGITSNGVYSIAVTFTPTDDNYVPSTTTVNLIVKNSNVITVNESTKDFVIGTTGNTTYIKVTSPNVENTTVTMFVNNKSIRTITITNSSAVVDLGKLALDAGDYNITFVYAGNDTYSASNATCALTVNPEMIGNLTTTNKTIDNVTINSVNKTFTLTLVNGTNASQTIDYTGDVGVYNSTNDLIGTVTMKNGTAIVDAKTLPGLVDGTNVLTFKINNNYASEPVDVTINTVQLPTDIIADNVTTTNNTNIIIKGTVTNATEGIVTVELYDKDNNLIAASIAIVNDDGTFNVAFANYANGVYTATIDYNSTTGLSKNNTKNITVTVNGTAPAPTGNITTNLTINSNFTEAYGEGLNLTGKLTDANGNPIVGQHIALNLTNPTTGASKIYWVTTDTNGEYQLQINLFAGSYTASASFGGFTTADNATTYLPAGPVNGTITVNNGTEPVDNRTATVLAFSNFTEKYGQALNFTGTLKTTNGTAIVGQKIALELFNKAGQSKVYWRTTDTDGAVQLPIELLAGDYTFKCSFAGDSTYQASNNQTGSITVTA